ncbi:hypothetical protein BDN70DRAFT_899489 [Pholiota conissans]|uniref:Uncharacterized protein n=1 Tax=Pholiota conissans TaxID=109636 RepID=A0A9P5YU23_9AGAR|nr:hypothetical protein BDN70DRAFT_899489 [Pholiota conissans]
MQDDSVRINKNPEKAVLKMSIQAKLKRRDRVARREKKSHENGSKAKEFALVDAFTDTPVDEADLPSVLDTKVIVLDMLTPVPGHQEARVVNIISEDAKSKRDKRLAERFCEAHSPA